MNLGRFLSALCHKDSITSSENRNFLPFVSSNVASFLMNPTLCRGDYEPPPSENPELPIAVDFVSEIITLVLQHNLNHSNQDSPCVDCLAFCMDQISTRAYQILELIQVACEKEDVGYLDDHDEPTDKCFESCSRFTHVCTRSDEKQQSNQRVEQLPLSKPSPTSSRSEPVLKRSLGRPQEQPVSPLTVQPPERRPVSPRAWKNPPSFVLSGISDSRSLQDNREEWDMFWLAQCEQVFGSPEDTPPKFDTNNIARVEACGAHAIAVCFLERPKKYVIDFFARALMQDSERSLDVSICSTQQSHTTQSLRRQPILANNSPRDGFPSMKNAETPHVSPMRRAFSGQPFVTPTKQPPRQRQPQAPRCAHSPNQPSYNRRSNIMYNSPDRDSMFLSGSGYGGFASTAEARLAKMEDAIGYLVNILTRMEQQRSDHG